MEELSASFCVSVLDLPVAPPPCEDPLFDLSILLDRDFRFPTDPTDGIEGVFVCSLTLAPRRQRGDKITVQACSSPSCPRALHDLIDDALNKERLRLCDARVTNVRMKMLFRDPVKSRPRSLSFSVSLPDCCSLKDDPHDQIAKNYLRRWGIARDGVAAKGLAPGRYTTLKRQIEALAACRLTFGMHAEGRVVTKKADPIERFDAWLQIDGAQRTLWPGVLKLSQTFYDTLASHAVPLDYRALSALKHSALALDVYTWLAHRLCRVRKPGGTKVSWDNLREQFGQEYGDPKNFKREFKDLLHQVRVVYPDARIDETIGGIILHESRPPLAKTTVSLHLPSPIGRPVDNTVG